MASVNREESYTPLAKTFHWMIAALMASMFVTIWIREETERGSPARAFWTDAHTSLGILVFALTVARPSHTHARAAAVRPVGSGT